MDKSEINGGKNSGVQDKTAIWKQDDHRSSKEGQGN